MMNKLCLSAYVIVFWEIFFGYSFCIVYFVQIINYMQVFENFGNYLLAGIKDWHKFVYSWLFWTNSKVGSDWF